MTEGRYPHGEALFPDDFEEHTVIFLVRPPGAPDFSDAELERLHPMVRAGRLAIDGARWATQAGAARFASA